MEIGKSRLGEYLVLHAAGRIDNLTSDAFQTELLVAVAEGDADLIIDLAQVEYISSAGFRALMTAARQKPKGRRIAVAGLNELVQELFAIARFHHVIPVFASPADATSAWQSPPEPQSFSGSSEKHIPEAASHPRARPRAYAR